MKHLKKIFPCQKNTKNLTDSDINDITKHVKQVANEIILIMSNPPKQKQQLSQAYSQLNQQYNSLLQKNQNDLIKIKQKQKTFNETLQTLKQQKQENEKKYKNDINVLMLELEKIKNGVATSTKDLEKKDSQATVQKVEEKGDIEDVGNKQESREVVGGLKRDIQDAQKQNKMMKQIIDQKNERVQHLQENARKLMDENINLTQKYEEMKKQFSNQSQRYQSLSQKNIELLSKISQLQASLKQKTNIKLIHQSHQTQGEYISIKEHTHMIQKFNTQIKQMHRQIENKEEQYEQLKGRLRETNDQLKRFMERDKRNAAILKKKSQELQNIQVQMENVKKSHKTQRKRLNTEEACAKCKQWEQENKLLKQMIKSMQTMVRVREMEAERYKNRQALNNSKIHEKAEYTQPKKSKGQLPPLAKRN